MRRAPERPEGTGATGASLGARVGGNGLEVVLIRKGGVWGQSYSLFPAVGFRPPGIAQILPGLLPATPEEAPDRDSGEGCADLSRP